MVQGRWSSSRRWSGVDLVGAGIVVEEPEGAEYGDTEVDS
jgi:hypothetical protein